MSRAPILEDLEGTRALATLSEVAAIADVRADVLRRDVKKRVITSAFKEKVRFYLPDVLCLTALYHGTSKLLSAPSVRRTLFSEYRERLARTGDEFHFVMLDAHNQLLFRGVLETLIRNHIVTKVRSPLGIEDWLLDVGDVALSIKRAYEFVEPRINLYFEGLNRTEIREDIAGGDRVFRGSRLTVRNVAEMLEAGDTVEMILEDYPYLARDDVEFARLYHRANPPRGRPRTGAGGDSAETNPR